MKMNFKLKIFGTTSKHLISQANRKGKKKVLFGKDLTFSFMLRIRIRYGIQTPHLAVKNKKMNVIV